MGHIAVKVRESLLGPKVLYAKRRARSQKQSQDLVVVERLNPDSLFEFRTLHSSLHAAEMSGENTGILIDLDDVDDHEICQRNQSIDDADGFNVQTIYPSDWST